MADSATRARPQAESVVAELLGKPKEQRLSGGTVNTETCRERGNDSEAESHPGQDSNPGHRDEARSNARSYATTACIRAGPPLDIQRGWKGARPGVRGTTT